MTDMDVFELPDIPPQSGIHITSDRGKKKVQGYVCAEHAAAFVKIMRDLADKLEATQVNCQRRAME